VKAHILNGILSAGHARMLVGAANAEQLAEEIVARGLNVRQVEALAREAVNKGARAPGRTVRKPSNKSTDTVALEKQLSNALGLVVSIDHRGDKGVVSIRYRNLEQLDDLAQRLGNKH
jgi:ParB family transcriptional regulator, chromosome partitioning protein